MTSGILPLSPCLDPLPEDLVLSLTGAAGSWRVPPDRSGGRPRFLFDGIPPGTYRLAIHVGGPYEPDEPVEVEVQRPELCSEIGLRLHWKGVVHGRVVDAEGRPVPNAPIVVISGRPPLDPRVIPFEVAAVTNDRSEFTHRYLPPGDYTLGMHNPAVSRNCVRAHQ
jgi:hypothetical protein